MFLKILKCFTKRGDIDGTSGATSTWSNGNEDAAVWGDSVYKPQIFVSLILMSRHEYWCNDTATGKQYSQLHHGMHYLSWRLAIESGVYKSPSFHWSVPSQWTTLAVTTGIYPMGAPHPVNTNHSASQIHSCPFLRQQRAPEQLHSLAMLHVPEC
jgi:hypothetical protein